MLQRLQRVVEHVLPHRRRQHVLGVRLREYLLEEGIVSAGTADANAGTGRCAHCATCGQHGFDSCIPKIVDENGLELLVASPQRGLKDGHIFASHGKS